MHQNNVVMRIVTFLVICFLVVACQSEVKVAESSILPGMTIEEVKMKFGEPSFEMSPALITTLTYGQTVIVFDTAGKAVAVNDKILSPEDE